jgi:hypothetical protein
MRSASKTRHVTPIGKLGKIRSNETLQISCGRNSSKTAQFIRLAALAGFAMACLAGSTSVSGQSRRPATTERRSMLARMLRPQSENRRNIEGRASGNGQNSNELPNAVPVRYVATSSVLRGDIVFTREDAPLKMGTKTLEVLLAGTELTVLDTRDVWLGVVGQRDDREIRGWVKARFVASPRVEIRVEETSLAPAMDGVDWPSATVTADGKRLAYVVRENENSRVVVDGEPGETFDRIEPGQPILSRGGSRIAYAAMRDGQWFVVVDEAVSGPYESVQLGHPIVSADESTVLAVVRKEEGQFLMANGDEGVAYREILADSPILSPDGKHYAYASRSDGRWLVHLDGNEATSFDEVAIEDMAFRIDGEQFACIGQRDGSDVVWLGKEDLASHEDARLPLFLPDGRLCYQAYDKGKWSIVAGSERSEHFDDVGDFVVDIENNGVAFWARDGNRWRVVRGEEMGPEYDSFGPGSLTLAPVGQRSAYVAIRDGKARVVIDDKESPPYEAVLAGTPVFSPTGQSVAYAALKEGRWRLFVDQVEQRAYDSIAEFSVRFTPDGSLPLALVGRGEQLALAVGDAVSRQDYLFPRGSFVLPIAENRFMMVAARGDDFLHVEVEVEIKR